MGSRKAGGALARNGGLAWDGGEGPKDGGHELGMGIGSGMETS